jgi:hypothetical protein
VPTLTRGGGTNNRANSNSSDRNVRAGGANASKPPPPLVFDDTCKGSDVFPSAGDREVTVKEQLAFERKGHVCIRGIIKPDEASEMVSGLIKETKARQLEAFRHRISVLCPGQDASRWGCVRVEFNRPVAVESAAWFQPFFLNLKYDLPVSQFVSNESTRAAISRVNSPTEAMQVLEKHSEEEVGFLQTFNLHRPGWRAPGGAAEGAVSSPSTSEPTPCAEFILSKRLAKVAAQLLGVDEEVGLSLLGGEGQIGYVDHAGCHQLNRVLTCKSKT